MSSIIAWLFLLVLLAAVLTLARRTRGAVFMSGWRQPEHRTPSVRLICGALGIIIVAAVTAGTWQAISLDYIPEPDENEVRLRVPTKPVPLPSKSASGFMEVQQTRLLVHLVAVEASPAGLIPLNAESIDMHWSLHQQPVVRRFGAGQYQVMYRFLIRAVYYSRTRASDNLPTLKVVGQHDYQIKDASGNLVKTDQQQYASPLEKPWMVFGKRDIIDLVRLEQDSRPPQSQFSTTPRSAGGNIHLLFFVTRLTDDDPLASTSWAQFCQQWGSNGAESIWAEVREPWTGTFSGLVDRNASVRGLALLVRWGFSGLLLLIATVLFTQVFRHRVLAFPAALGIIILYSAALDRAVMRVHLSRLDNPQSSLTTRLVACDRLGYTFFFRRSATRRLEALMTDVRTPEPLRFLASNAICWLTRPLPSLTGRAGIMPLPEAQPLPIQIIDRPPATFSVGPYPRQVRGAVVSPDGRLMAVFVAPPIPGTPASRQGDTASGIQIWDIQTGQLKHSIPYPGIDSFDFSPDGKTLAVLSNEWTDSAPSAPSSDKMLIPVVRLWDLQATSPRLVRTLTLALYNYNESMVFSPDGKMLLCTGDSRVELWDVAPQRNGAALLRWWRDSNSKVDAVMSPDGRTLAMVGKWNMMRVKIDPMYPNDSSNFKAIGGGAVELWDIPPGVDSAPRLRRTLPTEYTRALSISPDGKRLVCLRTMSAGGLEIGDAIQMFDLRTGKLQWRRLTDHAVNPGLELPFGLPFSPDGKLLAISEVPHESGAADISNQIELWDTRTGNTLRKIEQLPTSFTYPNTAPSIQPIPGVRSIQFSADRESVAILQGEAVRITKISDFAAVP